MENQQAGMVAVRSGGAGLVAAVAAPPLVQMGHDEREDAVDVPWEVGTRVEGAPSTAGLQPPVVQAPAVSMANVAHRPFAHDAQAALFMGLFQQLQQMQQTQVLTMDMLQRLALEKVHKILFLFCLLTRHSKVLVQ